MPAFISSRFQLDTIDSNDFNIISLKTNVGQMTSIPIVGNQKIRQVFSVNSELPFFQGSNLEPIKLDFLFMPLVGTQWTKVEQSKIFEWLFGKKGYRSFRSYDDFNTSSREFTREFKIAFTSPIQFSTVNMFDGYLSISATAYPVAFTPENILSSNGSIQNKSNLCDLNNNVLSYLKLEINVLSNTNINVACGETQIIVNNLLAGDKLILNNTSRSIKIFPERPIIKDWNKVYPALQKGINQIRFSGNASFKLFYRFPVFV